MSIYKPAKYRVIIIKNGEYLNTLHRCQKRSTVFSVFRKLKEENKKNIIFPKKYLSTSKGTKPVEFKILAVKVTEDNDNFRILRDKYGRNYIEKPIGIFTILDDDVWNVEEHFWIYGMDSKKNRPTIKEIVKRLASGAYKKNMVKQVIVLYNKLIIWNEEYFDMVLCKNREDARRLQFELEKASNKLKIKSLIFAGIAKNKPVISNLYKIIQERTGWKMKKIQRYTNI